MLISTTGKFSIFAVWMSVSASKSSSIVPRPPGMTTKAYEYFTSMTLRTKKCSNATERSRYGFSFCSSGSTMLQPTVKPPASLAPRGWRPP